MASNALCALCGLIVAAVVNFYGVSAQKSKWNFFFEFKTLVAVICFFFFSSLITQPGFAFLRNRGTVVRERLRRCFCEHDCSLLDQFCP